MFIIRKKEQNKELQKGSVKVLTMLMIFDGIFFFEHPFQFNAIKTVCEPLILFILKLYLTPAALLKKRLAQVFSCEFCDIFKNSVFYRTPPVVASVRYILHFET